MSEYRNYIFVLGTTAEAIKVKPLIFELLAINKKVLVWATQQQGSDYVSELNGILQVSDVSFLHEKLSTAAISSKSNAVIWFLKTLVRGLRHGVRVKRGDRKSLVFVHGDTLSTLAGALLAKLLGFTLVHIEAGLRSNKLWHPFPEELVRIIVTQLADVHYASTIEAFNLLMQKKKDAKYTQGNTAIDNLKKTTILPESQELKDYGLILLHRFELLSNKSFFTESLMTIVKFSRIKVIFVCDEHSLKLTENVLASMSQNGNFELRAKMPHSEFLPLLENSRFVVTDSGGVQEEVAILGNPTMVHRVATERSDGLGRNVTLSGWELAKLEQFLAMDAQALTPKATSKSPTKEILADLESRGWLA